MWNSTPETRWPGGEVGATKPSYLDLIALCLGKCLAFFFVANAINWRVQFHVGFCCHLTLIDLITRNRFSAHRKIDSSPNVSHIRSGQTFSNGNMATTLPCFFEQNSISIAFQWFKRVEKIASIYSFDEPKHFYWHISVARRKSELYEIMKQVFGCLINGKRFPACETRWIFMIMTLNCRTWQCGMKLDAFPPHSHPLRLVRCRRCLPPPMLMLPHNLQVACKILLLNNTIWCVLLFAIYCITASFYHWTARMNRIK